MAASPRWKVYSADSEYVGCTKYPEDAAALVGVQGNGATVRLGHRVKDTVWTEGGDSHAADSYDDAAAEMMRREQIILGGVW